METEEGDRYLKLAIECRDNEQYTDYYVNLIMAKKHGNKDLPDLCIMYLDADYERIFKVLEDIPEDEKNVEIRVFISRLYYIGAGVKKDTAKAIEYIKPLVNKGEPEAIHRLARYMLSEKKFHESMELFKIAAEKGYLPSNIGIGDIYSIGGGAIQQDHFKSLEYYKKGINNRDGIAEIAMGIAYYFGHGVECDYSKALEYFETGLTKEYMDTWGLVFIGIMNIKGEGTEKNIQKGVEYLSKAAKNIDVFAKIDNEEIRHPLAMIDASFSVIELLNKYKNKTHNIQKLKEEENNCIEKIKQLSIEIDAVKYRPGGIGAIETQTHFDELSKKQNT